AQERAGGDTGRAGHPAPPRRSSPGRRAPRSVRGAGGLLAANVGSSRQEGTRPMTTTREFAAERAQLGRRDRDELHEIASAMGVRGATRLRKADLIEAILDKATSGASVPEPTGEKPKKRTPRRKAADAPDAVEGAEAPETLEATAPAEA